MIGQWIRRHCWPWTAIARAYKLGFLKGVDAGGRAVSEHLKAIAQQSHLESLREQATRN